MEFPSLLINEKTQQVCQGMQMRIPARGHDRLLHPHHVCVGGGEGHGWILSMAGAISFIPRFGCHSAEGLTAQTYSQLSSPHGSSNSQAMQTVFGRTACPQGVGKGGKKKEGLKTLMQSVREEGP